MVRIARIGAGIGLVLLGLFLLVLPGPGILTIAGGLAILAVDFVWARNLLDWMKRRFREYFTGADQEPPASPDGDISPNARYRSLREETAPPNASLGGETTDRDYEGG